MNIAKLREELKRISPWPWHRKLQTDDILDADNFPVASCVPGKFDHSFIEEAPERIAKLFDVVEAAKMLIEDYYGSKDGIFESVEHLRTLIAALEADDDE